ncbi:DNA-directed RNA polymerase III subunit RPC8 [Vigna unguiculata]|uniref:DNA-directed RNA polymerase subunit n=2 Tax=Vigna unguiculata TaxID=3917 RepID=A0A4D6MY09_VIGUN|nr:DNA-directed RNA polymerase III subunit RPC8 [Vigna unguiculata]
MVEVDIEVESTESFPISEEIRIKAQSLREQERKRKEQEEKKIGERKGEGSMFYLSQIEHKLPLPPPRLVLPIREAIHMELEKLFLDKVIANLGLCISVYDIRSIDGGFIFPGDGAPTYTVVFNLIMFRPFVGEIITAKLISSDSNGLQLSLGFFDDIYVPAHHMPYPNHFVEDEQGKRKGVWFWDFNEQEYPIQETDVIKFQVQNVSYPQIPVEQPKESKPFAPMLVTGSLDHDGLGPVSWWCAEEIEVDDE